MSFIKYPLPESVLQATEQRIQWVLDNFHAFASLSRVEKTPPSCCI